MINFTQNNHLKYKIGHGPYFNFRTSSHEEYHVEIGSIDYEHYKQSSYEQELRRTADDVYRQFGKDIILFLSGGTDSEIVAHNFLSIGVKPRCLTIKFKNDYNADDVEEAKRIAKILDLKLDIVELDLHDFLLSGLAKDFGEKIQCTQITYIMVYYHVFKFQTPAVMGGEALFTRSVSTNPTKWYYTFRENEDASAMRFSTKYNIPLVNEWFSYTPELLLYYIETDEMKSLFKDNNFKLSSVSSKNAILRKLCPYVSAKNKTHGFEKILGFNHEAYKEIGFDQVKRLEASIDGIYVEDLYRQLKGDYSADC